MGMEQDDVIEVYQEQTGGGMVMFETLDESPEYTFNLQVRGAGGSQAWLTVLPGMDMRDIKRSFCDQVGVPDSMVKFTLYSYHRKKVVADLKDEATPEALGIGPDDVLQVDPLRFLCSVSRMRAHYRT